MRRHRGEPTSTDSRLWCKSAPIVRRLTRTEGANEIAMAKPKLSRLADRVRRGVDLIVAANGTARVQVAGYLGWDLLNHLVQLPGYRTELNLDLRGCKVTFETFSSQLGPYLDIFTYGVYEQIPEFKSRPGDVVIDAGANIGFFAMRAGAQVGPTGKVYAFEPNPKAFELLRRNVEQNGLHWVECIPAALSDRAGEIRFESDSRASSCGRLLRDDEGSTAETTTVRCTTLDAFVRERGIKRIHLIKMDTEGAEVDIVKGAMETAIGVTKRVVMESHLTRYGVRDLLVPNGFELVKEGWHPNVLYFARPALS